MDLIRAFFRTVYNVEGLINLVGMTGIPFIVFAETGLMVGFFLPGDSLLVTAGVFAARGDLNIYLLIPVLIVAAIAGNTTGYFIGSRAGHALYSRPNSFLFRREHLVRTHEFYERHGGKTIILAQFMPIVRTFAPVVAGAAGMTYRRFASFNVIGAICWVASMTLLGFSLARVAQAHGFDIGKRIDIVVAVVIFLSLLPGIIAWIRAKLQARAAVGSDSTER